MKCYKDKFKTSLQLFGINFTMWDMVAKGFWDAKHLLMLLKSINKTADTSECKCQQSNVKVRNTRSCISDTSAN